MEEEGPKGSKGPQCNIGGFEDYETIPSLDPCYKPESFWVTPHLRILEKEDGTKVIQQMYQGQLGTQKWEDLPIVKEHEQKNS